MSRSKKNWDHLVDARGNYKDIGGLPEGITFDKGDKGDKGDDGLSVKGEKGSKGAIGQKGEDGESALDILEKGGVVPPGTTPGELADFLKGDKGYRGEKGEKGQKGLGDKGQKGQKGDAKQILTFQGEVADEAALGSIVNPINGDVYLTQDTGTLFAYADGNWVALNGVAAPIKGEKGESIKGEKGFKGNKGESLLDTLVKGNVIPPGSTPDDLATFLKGEKGNAGSKGNKGEEGAQGAGDKGEPGEKGDNGEKGSNGEKGVKGDGGQKGQKGTDGAVGQKGGKGDDGTAAPLFEYQGDVADVGSLPAAAAGNTGHVYYVTDVDKYVVSDGTTWRNMDSPGLTPNLQQVTDSGATTDKNVQIGSLIKLNTGSSVHELEAVDGNTDPLNSWIYTAMPGSGTVHGVMASTNGTWIAVKDTGSPDICRSTDNGNTWTGVRNSNNQGWLFVDTDDNGTWCACSYNGRGIYRSTDDGLTWTQVISSGDWQQVKCDKNGVWIAAAGFGSPLKRSIDNGATWSSVGGTFPCKAIAYDGEGKWMALGYTTQSKMKRSTDGGATWTDLTFPNARWYDCDHANGTWIAVNDDKGTSQRVYRSTNFGSGWSYQSSGVVAGLWQSIAADGYGNWIIRSINNYTNISKDDGLTWISSPTASGASYTLFYKNGYWGMGWKDKVAKLVTDRASNDSSLEFNGDLVATRNNLQPLIDAINAKANSDAIIHDYYPSTGITNQNQFNSWVVNQTMRIIDDLQKIFEGRAPD